MGITSAQWHDTLALIEKVRQKGIRDFRDLVKVQGNQHHQRVALANRVNSLNSIHKREFTAVLNQLKNLSNRIAAKQPSKISGMSSDIRQRLDRIDATQKILRSDYEKIIAKNDLRWREIKTIARNITDFKTKLERVEEAFNSLENSISAQIRSTTESQTEAEERINKALSESEERTLQALKQYSEALAREQRLRVSVTPAETTPEILSEFGEETGEAEEQYEPEYEDFMEADFL